MNESNHNHSGERLSHSTSGDPVSRRILEVTFSAVGHDFFRLLVCALAAQLGTRYAFVTECSELSEGKPVRLRTRAVWTGSTFGEDFEYSVVGTPCETILESRDCQVFPDAIQQAFPADAMLGELHVRSYIGVPLFSEGCALLGHLASMHVEPLQGIEQKLSILRVFATRASRELERVQVERGQLRRITELNEAKSRILPAIVPVCAWCKRVRDGEGQWDLPEAYIRKVTAVQITHGMCPDCESLFGKRPFA